MQLEQPTVNPSNPVLPEEVSFGGLPKESAALKIVLRDFERTESWLQQKQMALRWKNCQLLYDSPPEVRYWDGTSIPRNTIKTYTLAKSVQSIAPFIVNGLFSDDPPFMLKPRPGTKQDAVRAIGELLHYQLEDCGFRKETELGIQSCLTFGTAIWKWGWESFTRKRKRYVRDTAPLTLNNDMQGVAPTEIHTPESDSISVVEEDEQIDRPTFEHVDLHHIYVDPSLRVPDIRAAKFVIHRIKLSGKDLDRLRELEGYDIPSRETLLLLLFPPEEVAHSAALEVNQSNGNWDTQATPRDEQEVADPIERDQFEILERWDGEKVVAVLNRKLVIRSERHGYNAIPFLSVNWWNVPNSFYGLGLGHTLYFEQFIQQGLINARLDQITLNLNRGFIQVRGKNVPTQNIRLRPNGIYVVDDANALKPMDKIEAVPEGFAEVQASESRAESISGANEMMVQGNMPSHGRSSITRTATGVDALAGGSQSRMEAFVERLGDQVFEPTLFAFFEMDRDLLPMSTLRSLLNNELQTAYSGDVLEVLNARLMFDVLAAARIQQRRVMSQNLPFLMQALLTDPMHAMMTAQGMKVDVNALVNMLFDVSGWKNKDQVIVPMSDEDQQRAAMSNSGVQKMLSQQQQLEAQTNSRRQVIEDENTARAVRDVLREGIRHQMEGRF